MVAEHRELLEALQTRDPDVMIAQLESHIAVRPPAPAAARSVPLRRQGGAAP
jgi:DNA-binding GntR family transcriptional regulator